jgi:uncharacterized membrane protein
MKNSEDSVHVERIVMFSDGVFAIAITLLALEVRVPEADTAAFPQVLWALLPDIGVYALSFVIVGLYWVGHHRMFRYIERADDTLLWLNLCFLLCIAFLPVASSIIGHYAHPLAILLYCSVLCLASSTNMLVWGYASRGRRLTPTDLASSTVRALLYRSLSTVGVALLGMGVALLVSTRAAFVVLGCYAILAIVVRRPSADVHAHAPT